MAVLARPAALCPASHQVLTDLQAVMMLFPAVSCWYSFYAVRTPLGAGGGGRGAG